MTTSLYDLAADFAALEAALTESGGEWTPEVEAAFAAIGGLEAERLDAYRAVVAQLEAHATACRGEAEAFQTKANVASNAVKRLKARLQDYLVATGRTEVKGNIWRAVLTANGGKPPLTVLVSPEALPELYQRPRIEADTEALRAAAGEDGLVLADGREIARIEPRGQHVRFR